MKLSKLEQESIILYNEEESTASIYTHDPKLKRKLKRLAEKYPDKVYPDKAVHAGRGQLRRAEKLRQRPGAVQRRAAQGRQQTRQKRRIYAARKEYILRK